MLKLLSITNFAVVSEATFELEDGLNLLTGETGAGKSIFVDALEILLGGRASADIVRSGEMAATIQGVFDVEHNDALRSIAGEVGIDVGDGELIVRREISDRAKSRAYVNDQVVTLGLLRNFRPLLIDIHGQGDQQSLLYSEAHVHLLDDFGGLAKQADDVRRAYAHVFDVRRELAELERSEAERLRSLDILAFQVSDIERVAPLEGEDEQLEQTRQILANAEKLVQLSADAYAVLYDDATAIVPALGGVERRLEQLAAFDGRFSAYVEQLRTVKYTLEDLAYFLRDYLQDVDFTPERLKEVEDRLVDLERLKRKYGVTVVDVLRSLDGLRAELARLEESESRAVAINRLLIEAKNDFIEKAHQLSLRRRKAAKLLEAAVLGELAELAMEQTRFVVDLEPAEDEKSWSEHGVERVEFFVATNPGEEPRPLARIASGGETSRLMLALKTVSAPPEIPRTLVFDEVDVGIGGRVSEAVGQRLARLASSNQVLCVTHQAQIARFADAHFTVRKEVSDERAVTSLIKLDRRGQVEELARMIGGADITETARKHARELLKTK